MIIDKRLYVGCMPDRSVIRIIRKIKKFKLCTNVYVVTLPLFHDGMLEIYNMNEFQQKLYRDMEDSIHIVGIAPTRRMAVYLVRDIVDDVYKKTGGFDMESYFSNAG
ncbi:MAG: hypothetical protein J6L77_08600 [Coprococcus sp.]|nr:hypothetical protein [Coprococcus sp.]